MENFIKQVLEIIPMLLRTQFPCNQAFWESLEEKQNNLLICRNLLELSSPPNFVSFKGFTLDGTILTIHKGENIKDILSFCNEGMNDFIKNKKKDKSAYFEVLALSFFLIQSGQFRLED